MYRWGTRNRMCMFRWQSSRMSMLDKTKGMIQMTRIVQIDTMSIDWQSFQCSSGSSGYTACKSWKQSRHSIRSHNWPHNWTQARIHSCKMYIVCCSDQSILHSWCYRARMSEKNIRWYHRKSHSRIGWSYRTWCMDCTRVVEFPDMILSDTGQLDTRKCMGNIVDSSWLCRPLSHTGH